MANSVSKHRSEVAGAAEERLLLKVHDEQGHTVSIKIRKSAQLRKLMDAYCNQVGSQASGVRFTAYGERLEPNYTAGLLGLESEDVVDVTTA